MLALPFQNPPVQSLDWEPARLRGIHLEVLRLDLVHPDAGGNKWFKLGPNLAAARAEGYTRVLSFGGAYSNHLRALAVAAGACGLESIGLVRGELPLPLNPVLQFASQQGMVLHALARDRYRRQEDPELLVQLRDRFGDFFLIPSGGANHYGISGCEEIVSWIPTSAESGIESEHQVVMAVGTGTTLAGIINGLARDGRDCRVTGIAVVGSGEFLIKDTERWLSEMAKNRIRWGIETAYAGRGFGRSTAALLEFCSWFTSHTGIPVEPVYTGKLFAAVLGRLEAGLIPSGSRLTILHTGGVHPQP